MDRPDSLPLLTALGEVLRQLDVDQAARLGQRVCTTLATSEPGWSATAHQALLWRGLEAMDHHDQRATLGEGWQANGRRCIQAWRTFVDQAGPAFVQGARAALHQTGLTLFLEHPCDPGETHWQLGPRLDSWLRSAWRARERTQMALILVGEDAPRDDPASLIAQCLAVVAHHGETQDGPPPPCGLCDFLHILVDSLEARADLPAWAGQRTSREMAHLARGLSYRPDVVARLQHARLRGVLGTGAGGEDGDGRRGRF